MILGWIAFLLLAILPGGWVAVVLPIRAIPAMNRVWLAVALSPAVLLAQFYALRLAGFSFENTAYALPFLNSPVIFWLWRAIREVRFPGWKQITSVLAVAAIPATFMLIQFGNRQVPAYTGHAWMQTDVIYSIARGALIPEDTDLVGVKLGYPWAGHVVQAVFSFLLGLPPAASFGFTNAICLVAISGLCIAIVHRLGGGRLAQALAVFGLLFGVNAVGYAIEHTLPAGFVRSLHIWGDPRYTPFLFYFFFFTMMPIAIMMFMAVAYLVVDGIRSEWSERRLAILGILLSGIAVIYPLLILPALTICGVLMAIKLTDNWRTDRSLACREAGALLLVLLLVGIVFATNQTILLRDRSATGAIEPSLLKQVVRKAIEFSIVFFPFLAALLVSVRTLGRQFLRETAVLTVGGVLASFSLYVLLDIKHYANEYKYVLTAAVCLAPFFGIALERILGSRRLWTVPSMLVVTALLILPFVHKTYYEYPWIKLYGPEKKLIGQGGPPLDLSRFDMCLQPGSRLAELTDRIRTSAPRDGILVARSHDLDLAALTQRPFYVSQYQDNMRPGVGANIDFLLKDVKAYNPRLIDDRRATVSALYESTSRLNALRTMQTLRRPLIILVDEDRDRDLFSWLRQQPGATLLHKVQTDAVWILGPTGTELTSGLAR